MLPWGNLIACISVQLGVKGHKTHICMVKVYLKFLSTFIPTFIHMSIYIQQKSTYRVPHARQWMIPLTFRSHILLPSWKFQCHVCWKFPSNGIILFTLIAKQQQESLLNCQYADNRVYKLCKPEIMYTGIFFVTTLYIYK